MNKENIIKATMLAAFLLLFLLGSRFQAEANKVVCLEEKCEKPHAHGELNFHEQFPVEHQDSFGVATVKSSANFWIANASGMTFALVIAGAGLSLVLSYKRIGSFLETRGLKGAALGSVIGMPLNMCANCSAVASVGINARSGSAESTLGVILGGALFNFIGIATMFTLFDPAVVVSRIVFSLMMILIVVPLVSKTIVSRQQSVLNDKVANAISCYFPEKTFLQTMVKAFEDWLILTGNLAIKLLPLMFLGTVLVALFRVLFPNEVLEEIGHYNPLLVIVIISFIGTFLSIPVLFEILLGTVLLQLGFSNGAIAAMLFTAPSYGIFTMVLTREKLGGYKVPIILIATTFLFGIGTGLLADFLTPYL
ncbi:permease [Chryseolinea sp. T2]|uniref:permease n=1 Tax=Chryseolinea sp. T2 TaxID=3129255 RepID=UPI0030781D0D